jgi:probable rRNA maturation factor
MTRFPTAAAASAGRELSVSCRHPRLRLNRAALGAMAALLDARAAGFRGGCPPGELSLVFLGEAALARLHAEFLDDPAPTDVITFAGDPAQGQAGEICVSVDAAIREARVRRRPFAAELLLYAIHGWLHLAGYDDLVPAKKRAMRRAEARAMRLLDAGGLSTRWATLRPHKNSRRSSTARAVRAAVSARTKPRASS